jgi:transcriptional regulator with XRE-family HTH domain
MLSRKTPEIARRDGRPAGHRARATAKPTRRPAGPGAGPPARRSEAGRGVRIGERLRELRQRARTPLTALAAKAGLSPGYLSQVERDLATPSTTALARLSDALGVPVGHFFESSGERVPGNYVVRRDARRTIIYPGSTVRSELLVSDLRGKLEGLYFRARPGAKSPVYKHDGEEFGYIFRGRLRITIGDDVFTLGRGDSICFPCHVPHWWEALGTGVEALWVVTPPSW